MDNKSLIVNSELFSNSINDYDKKIAKIVEVLNNISKVMKKIDGKNEIWESITAEAVYNKFSNIEKNFEKINAELNVYSIFLKETLESFKLEEKKEEKAVQQNDLEVNVN